MKRSELKPGKPLKAGGKIKRKKKTALQKRIDKKDSPYWGNKCSAAVTAWAHKQACLISGKREPETRLVCGHHLIRKSRSRLYRWHPMNIIPLSEEHHLTSTLCAAHSDNILAVARFVDAMRALSPTHFDWLVDHQDAIRKTDMRGPIERPDWRAQYEYWSKKL